MFTTLKDGQVCSSFSIFAVVIQNAQGGVSIYDVQCICQCRDTLYLAKNQPYYSEYIFSGLGPTYDCVWRYG